jgi:hypothetical protein
MNSCDSIDAGFSRELGSCIRRGRHAVQAEWILSRLTDRQPTNKTHTRREEALSAHRVIPAAIVFSRTSFEAKTWRSPPRHAIV